MFVFIGVQPHARWLGDQLALDDQGFILTGADAAGPDGNDPPGRAGRRPLLLETSRPGVFAAGDVRSGSIKRVASAVGKANGRDVIQPWDLPITKGLQERIHEFETSTRRSSCNPSSTTWPNGPSSTLPAATTPKQRLPAIAGGLSLALARAFKLIDPKVKNPSTEQWDHAFRISALLL